ncbi:hypothetical protein GGQ12_002900 [Salinibacter ruber]|nr:hypothetical protein [Salinibacter ruber]
MRQSTPRLRSRAKRQPTPTWLYLIGLFALLIVLQGALRKWGLPNLSTPLYILKDVVLLGGLGLYLFQYDFQLPRALRSSWFPLLWGGFACIVVLQAFNLNQPSVAVGILGIRNYLLYSVLLVIMPRAIQYIRRPTRVVTYVAFGVVLPVLLLGFYQYRMPPGHWINRYVAAGAPVSNVAGDPRITGTFSYIQGMGVWLTTSLAFSTSILVAGLTRGRKRYQLLGGALLTLSLIVAPMNGSRSVIFGYVGALPFVLYAALQRKQGLSLILAFCVLLAAGAYSWSRANIVSEAWTPIKKRTEKTTFETFEKRITGPILRPFQIVAAGGVSGYGAGTTHPGARALSSEGRVDTGTLAESELGRVLLELGVFGFILFLGLKLWLLWMAWEAMLQARNSWEDIICITTFVLALVTIGHEKIVFNHIGGALYWLLIGATAWVWCRHQSHLPSVSRPQNRMQEHA